MARRDARTAAPDINTFWTDALVLQIIWTRCAALHIDDNDILPVHRLPITRQELHHIGSNPVATRRNHFFLNIIRIINADDASVIIDADINLPAFCIGKSNDRLADGLCIFAFELDARSFYHLTPSYHLSAFYHDR